MPSNLRSHAVILPAIWSSYLVNGDATGLSEEDRRQADDFLTLERLPSPASVEPDGFGQADATLALGGNAALFQDLSRYTFLVPATVPDVAPNADAEEEEEEEEADPTFACYSCDEIAPEEDATDIGGRLYCPGCWRTCYRCEESIPLDESYTVHNRARGRWTAVEVCESCRGNAYPSCDGCGDHHHEDHTIYRESRDASFCVDCDPGEVNDDNDDDSGNGLSHGPFAIRSYHSVAEDMGPIVSPWTEANGQRYLGVELEVECSYTAGPGREESARRILQSVHAAAEAVTEGRAAGRRLLGAENDGSLTHGFELVSAPLGLDDHARLWRTVLTREHCVGMKSHQTTTCGLHVHLSRTGLTSLQIAKMVVFINAEGIAEYIAPSSLLSSLPSRGGMTRAIAS